MKKSGSMASFTSLGSFRDLLMGTAEQESSHANNNNNNNNTNNNSSSSPTNANTNNNGKPQQEKGAGTGGKGERSTGAQQTNNGQSSAEATRAFIGTWKKLDGKFESLAKLKELREQVVQGNVRPEVYDSLYRLASHEVKEWNAKQQEALAKEDRHNAVSPGANSVSPTIRAGKAKGGQRLTSWAADTVRSAVSGARETLSPRNRTTRATRSPHGKKDKATAEFDAQAALKGGVPANEIKMVQEKPVIEGYLYKRAKQSGRNWKKRYFYVYPHKLEYYSNKDDTGPPKGEMWLSENFYVADSAARQLKNPKEHGFMVSDLETTYYLAGESREVKQFWMHTLARVIRRLQTEAKYFDTPILMGQPLRTESGRQADMQARLAAYQRSLQHSQPQHPGHQRGGDRRSKARSAVSKSTRLRGAPKSEREHISKAADESEMLRKEYELEQEVYLAGAKRADAVAKRMSRIERESMDEEQIKEALRRREEAEKLRDVAERAALRAGASAAEAEEMRDMDDLQAAEAEAAEELEQALLGDDDDEEEDATNTNTNSNNAGDESKEKNDPTSSAEASGAETQAQKLAGSTSSSKSKSRSSLSLDEDDPDFVTEAARRTERAATRLVKSFEDKEGDRKKELDKLLAAAEEASRKAKEARARAQDIFAQLESADEQEEATKAAAAGGEGGQDEETVFTAAEEASTTKSKESSGEPEAMDASQPNANPASATATTATPTSAASSSTAQAQGGHPKGARRGAQFEEDIKKAADEAAQAEKEERERVAEAARARRDRARAEAKAAAMKRAIEESRRVLSNSKAATEARMAESQKNRKQNTKGAKGTQSTKFKDGVSADDTGGKGEKWLNEQINQLIQIIKEIGIPGINPGEYVVTFGELFERYSAVSDTLVGVLLRAKRRNIVSFQGDMLFQGEHDGVEITYREPKS